MARDHARNDTRSRIAHFAARLMAEDGIEDYALAKRKAARQVRASDSRQLPTNEEVDAALRAYQQLYYEDEHRTRLQQLREKAVRAMRELAHFSPHLTGSVLNGNAGKYADINLQLFTENAKSVEHYLLDRRIPYKTTQSRLYAGDAPCVVPVFTVNDDGTEIELTVLSLRDQRGPLKTSAEGKPIERARLETVEILLSET